MLLLNNKPKINTDREACSGDSSDSYDSVLDSIMTASPIDQPVPIDAVEPIIQPTDKS